MRKFLKWTGLSVLLVVVAAASLIWFAPVPQIAVNAEFDPRKFSEGVDAYLKSVESGIEDIRPGSEKRVIWAGQKEARTPLSLVYFHGFSASSEEIRPVPDLVAKALGANLVYTRFRGHGRDGDAMAEATADDWIADADEALSLARAVGDEIIVISTSTGGTIAAAAATDPDMSRSVKGIVYISPNFAINDPFAPILSAAGAQVWLPWLVGERRSFVPQNEEQALHWTTEYPTIALLPMAEMVRFAMGLDYSRLAIPALFYYSDDDQVVDAAATAEIEQRWAGEVTRIAPEPELLDDPYFHVISGAIKSPRNTDATVAAILGWIRGLP